MLDRPALAGDRPLGVGGLVGIKDLVDGGVADRVGGGAPAEVIDGLDDGIVFLWRHHGEPIEGAALAVFAGERLRHVPAFEAAVDQKLDAADAHPFVAFVLLERRFFDDFADAGRIALAEARKIDVVAQGERAFAPRRKDGVERLEELALIAAGNPYAGDPESIDLALGRE